MKGIKLILCVLALCTALLMIACTADPDKKGENSDTPAVTDSVTENNPTQTDGGNETNDQNNNTDNEKDNNDTHKKADIHLGDDNKEWETYHSFS